MRSFLDTNILVYAVDEDAGTKRETAQRLIEAETREGRALLSTQVLAEFYVAATRKLARPLDPGRAEDSVRALSTLPVVQIDPRTLLTAIARARRLTLSFWDALVLEAALVGGASILYSEDFQDGLEVENLTVRNPFR